MTAFSDIIIIPNRNTNNNPVMQFSGSASANIHMEVLPQGQLSVMGSSGSLLGVTDNLVGSLMAVSDVSGLPVLEVFSDDRVVMGQYNKNTLVVSGSAVGIGTTIPAKSLHILNDTIGNMLEMDSNNASGTGLVIVNSRRTSGHDWSLLSGNVSNGYFSVKDETAGLTRFVIDTSGNVGINCIPSGTYKLEVNGSLTATGELISSASSVVPATGAGITVNANGYLRRQVYKCTTTFAYFDSADYSVQKTICTIPPKTVVLGSYANVTNTFGGGTISAASLGLTATATYDILDVFDCYNDPSWVGLTDATMGTKLKRANAVQGGAMVSTGSYNIIAELHVLGDTADQLMRGSVTWYIITETLP